LIVHNSENMAFWSGSGCVSKQDWGCGLGTKPT